MSRVAALAGKRERDMDKDIFEQMQDTIDRADEVERLNIITAQVEAATLRAVGEALDRQKFSLHNTSGELHYVAVALSDIKALLAGKMPAGWEGR